MVYIICMLLTTFHLSGDGGGNVEMRQQGAITVFLTMTFLLVLSLIFSVIESARVQAVRMLVETGMDTALESLLAGYQRELYDAYDVLLFDGSNGSGSISEEKLGAMLNGNMQYVLQPDKDTLLKNTDFYRVSCGDITVREIALATDDEGMVFRDSAVNFIRDFLGESEIEALTGKYEWAMENIEQSNDYTEKETEVGDAIRGLEEEKSRIDEEKAEEAQAADSQTDPSVQVDQIRSMGILELVCQDTSAISQKSITLSEMPSGRKLYQGSGKQEYEEGVVANILFQNYLIRKFPHAASKESDTEGNLAYQLEYLLVGEGHDVDNLKGVINRLLMIREGANFAYLLTDGAKVAEAYSAAMLLVGYTCLPVLIEATKYAILLAWAYAESVLDVRVLLAGEKCALAKTAQTWKTSIGNMGEVASMDPKQMSDKNGITYEEYLQMLLLIADQRELSMRALDLMELQIRHMTQNEKFRIDCCVAAVEAQAEMDTSSVFLDLSFLNVFAAGKSKEMKITRKYSYDMW